MIYTVTLNPAIDYVAYIDDLTPGSIQRTSNENIFFGGKGINVSTVLKELDIKSTALGFLAGFTGKAMDDGLKQSGIETDFIYLDNGFTRINVKIRSGKETDINGKGPEISPEKLDELFEKLKKLKKGDILVLAGSIPQSVSDNIYEDIMASLNDKGVKFIVDATGDLLLNSLKYKPFLIKPNNDELGEIFGIKIEGHDEIVKYGKKLLEMGALNVLVSMGGDGAILLDENGEIHFLEPFDGKVINTVGSGDSMVAGFLAGYEKTGDYEYALKLGTAAGSATAYCEGLACINDINKLLN